MTLQDIIEEIIKTEFPVETAVVSDNIPKEPGQREPGENADLKVGCADVCVCVRACVCVCARARAHACVCVWVSVWV